MEERSERAQSLSHQLPPPRQTRDTGNSLMNNPIKIFAIILSMTALVAVTFATESPLQRAHGKLKASRIKQLPELSYFNGEVGLEYAVVNSSSQVIGDRVLIVTDLDPTLPKLLGTVSDDRAPLSGVLSMNGAIVNLRLRSDGLLAGTIPGFALNWYSTNSLQVEVFDGPADPSGAPTGRRIHRWVTATGSLL